MEDEKKPCLIVVAREWRKYVAISKEYQVIGTAKVGDKGFRSLVEEVEAAGYYVENMNSFTWGNKIIEERRESK